MVGEIGKLLSGLVQTIALVLVRAVRRSLSGEARDRFIERAVDYVVVPRAAHEPASPTMQKTVLSLNSSVLASLSGESHRIFVDELVRVIMTEDQKGALDAVSRSLADREMSAALGGLLVRTTCELFGGMGLPDDAIAAFEAASGGKIHYSQEGEDIVLARLLAGKGRGFFVDVGAHHARRFSNTYALYRLGWRGINIDATPGSMDSFRRLRPDDINLECAVSDGGEPLVFRVFEEGALNTFDSSLAQSYVDAGWSARGTIELVPRPLSDILDEYLPEGQHIDLLSVDVEGEDLRVLKSNDWAKYCPDIIVIEALETPLQRLDRHPVVEFLRDKEFVPIARLFNSIILQRN